MLEETNYQRCANTKMNIVSYILVKHKYLFKIKMLEKTKNYIWPKLKDWNLTKDGSLIAFFYFRYNYDIL